MSIALNGTGLYARANIVTPLKLDSQSPEELKEMETAGVQMWHEHFDEISSVLRSIVDTRFQTLN